MHVAIQEIRLNLGGRGTQIPGFSTVDLSDDHDVDYKADVSKLPFEDGSVAEIYASHILEHFPHPQTIAVLKEWTRVLKNGSKAYISVPDFDAAMRLYPKYGFTDFIRNLLYGDQIYALAYHYTTFTFPTLAKACVDAGFSDVKRISEMPYGLKDCSSNVDTFSKSPISVSVEATK